MMRSSENTGEMLLKQDSIQGQQGYMPFQRPPSLNRLLGGFSGPVCTLMLQPGDIRQNGAQLSLLYLHKEWLGPMYHLNSHAVCMWACIQRDVCVVCCSQSGPSVSLLSVASSSP